MFRKIQNSVWFYLSKNLYWRNRNQSEIRGIIFGVYPDKNYIRILFGSLCDIWYRYMIYATVIWYLISLYDVCYRYIIFTIVIWNLLSLYDICYRCVILAIIVWYLLSFYDICCRTNSPLSTVWICFMYFLHWNYFLLRSFFYDTTETLYTKPSQYKIFFLKLWGVFLIPVRLSVKYYANLLTFC